VRVRRGDPGPGVTAGPSQIELCVSDDGCGIPPEIYARVFEPFFTTKDAAQGTGLGLSLVADAVRGAGARIEIQSSPGKGTTVRVFFQGVEASMLPGGDVGVVAGPSESEPRRVVIYGWVRSSVTRPLAVLLRRRGWTVDVIERRDGVEQAALPLHGGPVSLALVEVSGREGLPAVEEPRDVPSILLRASGDAAEAVRGATGASSSEATVVDLPCDPMELLRTIDRLVSRPRAAARSAIH